MVEPGCSLAYVEYDALLSLYCVSVYTLLPLYVFDQLIICTNVNQDEILHIITPGEPEPHFHFETDPSCSPCRVPGVISLHQYLPGLNRAGMRWDGTAD